MLLGGHKKPSHWWRSPKNILMGMMLLAIIMMAAIILPYRGWLFAQIIPDVKKLIAQDKKVVSQTVKYLPASTHVDVDKIYLHVDYKELQKLAYMRQQAMENPTEKDFKYVKAELEIGESMLDAKIRLKGDRDIHYKHETNWSFRVSMKGEDVAYGMKYFSLHKPVTRNYLYEWLLHKSLEREDILALQYKFVNLYMNGTDLGIYALEEHFDKRMVERQKRREGPVIRFIVNYHESVGLGSAPIGSFRVDPDAPEGAQKQLAAAVDLLDSFRRGELPAEDVFDIEKLAMYFAISDLLGTFHGTISKSARFYYNPINAKLEPIGYDGHHFDVSKSYPFISVEAAVDPKAGWTYDLYSDWYELFFNRPTKFNKTFYVAYVSALKKVSSPDYLSALLSELRPGIEENLAILHRDFPIMRDNIFETGPDLHVFDTKYLEDRQKYILKALAEVPQIQAYLQKTAGADSVSLAFANTCRLPVEIVSVRVRGELLKPMQEDDVLVGKRVSSQAGDIPSYKTLSYELPASVDKADVAGDIEVTYRLVGVVKTFKTEPLPFPYEYAKGKGTEIMRSGSTHLGFPFIRVNEDEKKIFLKEGRHEVDRDLIFPAGYTVIASNGVSLDLRNFAMILSKSPFHFVGTEDAPITVESSDGTGQGLCILLKSSDKEVSIFDWVIFNGLSDSKKGAWAVSGAVTIYEGIVDISNTAFIANQSEDCLNLVRCKFKMSRAIFKNTLSDALDLDFSDGSIMDSEFTDSGNDAIDLSGSVVTIKNVMIDGVGDKAVSVGEKSSAEASNINIGDAEIAVTCKDNSYLKLSDCTIGSTRIAVTAYQKKPEFGPARIDIANLNFTSAEVPYMIEHGSSLTLDGEPFQSNYKKVKDILYGAEYGKSSK